MKVRGTDFVMFQVSDLANAARFYRETLGLQQEVYSEEWQWAEFNCGNVTLSLKGGVKPSNENAGGRIALAVEDVHAAGLELKQKGARILGEPVDHGVCQAVEALDPDGNTIILHKRADGTCGQNAGNEEDDAATILALERSALARWLRGDPSGFLEICSPEVVYFDPGLDRRLDGLEALTRLYESVRGKIHAAHHEVLNPKVQLCGESAVLTYNLISQAGDQTNRWNCTEVFRRTAAGWRIIQTHWSFTRPRPQ